MATLETGVVVSKGNASKEIARLLSLPRLERKLELICAPPTVTTNNIRWVFIDVLKEPDGFGGRFAAILTSKEDVGLLLEATKIQDSWGWEIYRNGTKLAAYGKHDDMFSALEQCAETAVVLYGNQKSEALTRTSFVQ